MIIGVDKVLELIRNKNLIEGLDEKVNYIKDINKREERLSKKKKNR
jgi:hypothetical protein